MKFILNEELSLEEADNWASRNAQQRARRRQTTQQASIDTDLEDKVKTALEKSGKSETDINDTLAELRANKKFADDWEKHLNGSNEDTTENQEDTQTNTSVKDRLLKAVKSSNDNGYENFLSGIKSNIKNNNFPFVQLLNNSKFSTALGLTESLTEAGAISNFVNNTTGKLKKATSNWGKGPSLFLKFASVYNAFIDNDIDSSYVNDDKAIVYDSRLYDKRNIKNIDDAIEIDYKAFKSDDNDKREELKKAVAKGEISQVSNVGESNKEKAFKSQLKAVKDTYNTLNDKSKEEVINYLRGA